MIIIATLVLLLFLLRRSEVKNTLVLSSEDVQSSIKNSINEEIEQNQGEDWVKPEEDKLKEQEKLYQVLKLYYNYLEQGEIEEAYEKLSADFKEEVFPSIQDYEKYISQNYNPDTYFTIIYSKESDGMYICKLAIHYFEEDGNDIVESEAEQESIIFIIDSESKLAFIK